MNRRHHHSVYGIWYVGSMVSKYPQNLLICQDSLQQLLFSEKEVVNVPMATTVTIFVWFYDLDTLLWWRSSLLKKVKYNNQKWLIYKICCLSLIGVWLCCPHKLIFSSSSNLTNIMFLKSYQTSSCHALSVTAFLASAATCDVHLHPPSSHAIIIS